MSSPQREETHFGDQRVPLAEKQGLVDDVFHKVADRYDLMNDLMSARAAPALEGRAGRQSAPVRATSRSRISMSPAALAMSPFASPRRAAR